MKDVNKQAKTDKLARKIGDADIAASLVEAGFDNPRKIRDASDETLEGVLGKAGKDKVRGKIAKKQVGL